MLSNILNTVNSDVKLSYKPMTRKQLEFIFNYDNKGWIVLGNMESTLRNKIKCKKPYVSIEELQIYIDEADLMSEIRGYPRTTTLEEI